MKHFLIMLCGIHSFGFALFHIYFWKLFDWKTTLSRMSVANRAIIQISNTRLIYCFLFISFICFFYPNDLLETRLGHALLAGCALFWVGRTIEQYIFLRVKNKMVNLLTLLFIFGAVLFALALYVHSIS